MIVAFCGSQAHGMSYIVTWFIRGEYGDSWANVTLSAKLLYM